MKKYATGFVAGAAAAAVLLLLREDFKPFDLMMMLNFSVLTITFTRFFWIDNPSKPEPAK